MSALVQPATARTGIARRVRTRVVTFIILVVIVCCLVLLSAMVGQYRVEATDVVRGVFGGSLADPLAESVLWQIRFPRIVLGLLVGASLAVAGTVMQALFSNPLAEPGIIGVSSGAAVGASIMIVVAPTFLAGFGVPAAAFLSGLLAASAVYVMARSGRRTESTTLTLTGIAVTAVCSAITSVSTYVAPTTARDQIVFWQMGSLNGATWNQVATIGTVAAVGIVWAVFIAARLDTLALGGEGCRAPRYQRQSAEAVLDRAHRPAHLCGGGLCRGHRIRRPHRASCASAGHRASEHMAHPGLHAGWVLAGDPVGRRSSHPCPLRRSSHRHLHGHRGWADLLHPVATRNATRGSVVMIRARGVSFRYGERTILDGVDLDVRAGEFVGLLGPNGAGKTTLLSVLCGDLDGWQGTVELDRVPLQDIARPDLALRRSVMPQFSEFPFSYLVHDIVMMGRSPHPRGPEDAILVEAAMERTEVTGLADREVTALSGGERSRVTLARVLAQDTPCVFLDEPTAALDICHQERTMEICQELAAAGCAVVAVMHDVGLAAACCDRIALLSAGKLVAVGDPEEVITEGNLTSVYGWPIDVITLSTGDLVVLPRRPWNPTRDERRTPCPEMQHR